MEKFYKRQAIFLSVLILLVVTILMGSSYAWFVVTDESSNNEVIKVGSLNLTFSDGGSDVVLNNQLPIRQDDISSVSPYTFTIANSGIKNDYTIKLEDATLANGENRINDQYVKYQLMAGNKIIRTGTVSSLTNGELIKGILAKNESATFTLRVFLDDEAYDSNAAGKTFKKKIKIVASQYEGKAQTTVCRLKEGYSYQIGAKYECDPGDGVKRVFYLLKEETSNVKLIMERNITDTVGSAKTMNYQTAMAFFTTGAGNNLGWSDVTISLPTAEEIANAVGNTSWKLAEKSKDDWFCLATKNQDYTASPYCDNGSDQNYLYDYTRACTNWGCSHSLDSSYAYGYWTSDLVSLQADSTTRAWVVFHESRLVYVSVVNTDRNGVRPVITVSKSDLS